MTKTAYRKRFRDILIFVAGTTPQIVTETIHGIIHQKPPVYPDEIHILTTESGKDIIKKNLLDTGRFSQFCKEFDLHKDSLTEKDIVVICDDEGAPLSDIREARDNSALGNFIVNFIREKAADDRLRLHCSLAGGRKTMSFYMGSALQLFGRPWDKLYHVLVTPEFESNPDFYYKPKKNRLIKKNGKVLNTKDAKIHLAELPFIRLSRKISFHGKSYEELVEEGQKDIDIAMVQPELSIRLSERSITIDQVQIKFTPVHLMLYTAYLRYKLNRCKYPDRPYCVDCTECFPSLIELATKPALEEMAKDYMLIAPSRLDDLLHNNRQGLSVDNIRQIISKIKRIIRKEIADETLASYYSITTSRREYAESRHGVRVEKGKIRIE